MTNDAVSLLAFYNIIWPVFASKNADWLEGQLILEKFCMEYTKFIIWNDGNLQ